MVQHWLARRRSGPKVLIEDAQFRIRAIGLATTGISRKGAAMRLGIKPDTLYDYLARGRAQPDVEPWGSFATDYLQAERGLEEAGSTAIGLWVAHLRIKCEDSPGKVDPRAIMTLERILERRYPQDRGISKHRLPEPDPDGQAWLERHQLTVEQLQELFRQPPEPVLLALVAAAEDVYRHLLASGWSPDRMLPDGVSSVPSESDGPGDCE